MKTITSHGAAISANVSDLRVVAVGDHVWRGTLGDWVQINEDGLGLMELIEILDALGRGETYKGGGGAAGAYSIKLDRRTGAETRGTWSVGTTQCDYEDEARTQLLGATVHVGTRDQIVAAVYGMSVEEAEANARLIAAAPALLSELKDILDHVERLGPGHEIYVRDARAAIAQAGGAK